MDAEHRRLEETRSKAADMRTPLYPSLYQINTRVWLTELSGALGRPATLDDMPDAELDRVAAMGFDWVWLLSVWRTGPAGQRVSRANREWRKEFEETLPDLREEDIAGSGFAITGYTVHRAPLFWPRATQRVRERAPGFCFNGTLQQFYEGLLAVLRQPVVRDGQWRLLECAPAWEGNWTSDCFIAWSWEAQDGQRRLIAVNYAGNQGQCYVRLPFPDLGGRTVRLKDLMGPASYDRGGDDLVSRGLYLDLLPWSYHVFEVTIL